MDTTPELDEKKEKKKDRDKVRSAWISFVGRIVAQLVGAIATVSLGVMMLQRYNGPDSGPAAAPFGGEPAVTVIIVSPPSQNPQIGAEPSALPPEIAARQVEMARAIALAVSGTRRTRQ